MHTMTAEQLDGAVVQILLQHRTVTFPPRDVSTLLALLRGSDGEADGVRDDAAKGQASIEQEEMDQGTLCFPNYIAIG